ncbi:glycosyltransferase family 4 protein [Brevundimonas sp.]|uniref:glycosyltransferase family 4 protein n=1 Tax=Brevundimonas sp. TaxID=1871086 RepID=UPI0025D31301|nr:glycosyltransferase family 4 protein [Brevundimonas sp.]
MATLPPNFTLLQVVPRLDAGGVERTTVDISRAVVEAGGRSLVASEGGRFEGELADGGGELVRLPVASKNPLTIWSNIGRLKRLIRAETVSLVHVRSRAPAFSALRAARRCGVPSISTYHGVYNARSDLKRWYNGVMTRADHVIANSDYTRRHVLDAYDLPPERITAVARGSDLARFDPAAVSPDRIAAARAAWGVGPDDGRTLFLLAGRLTRWKGQGLLVEAADRLKAQGRDDFVVVMIGDDQGRTAYRAEIEAMIGRAGLSPQVRLAGHFDDMPAAWLAADVAVAPSLEPEAFGRTAVEPQLMGRPVIVAGHGAPLETVLDGETGWRFPPGDAGALADRMAQAIEAGEQGRGAMGQAGLARARRLYSLDAMIEATFAVYRDVLERAVLAR